MTGLWFLLLACSGGEPNIDTAGLEPVGLRFDEVDIDARYSAATDLVFLPDGTALLATKSGEVGHLRLTEDGFEEILTFTLPQVYDDRDCGLISLTPGPDWQRTGYVFAGLCTSETASGVFRFELGDDADATAASLTEVLVLDEPEASNPWHNVGALTFDADGYLWAPFGDKTVRSNGQNRDTALGSIVRIRPTETGYDTHPDAPIADTPEIWATGVRSPWRAALDASGNYWFGDVGAADFEEINVVTEGGQNFAWSRHEGLCDESCEPYTDPVAVWGHEGIDDYQLQDPDVVPTAGRASYVGLAYSAANDQYEGWLTDTVVFGDFCQGFVRGLRVTPDGSVTDDVALGHLDNPVGWAEASDGTVYVTTFGACESSDGGRMRTRIHRVGLRYQ